LANRCCRPRCPAFASGTLIEAKSPTFGCQFSATLGLFQELSTASEEDSNRILDTGHCLPIDAHQRFTVVHDLPSAYVALKDTQQHDQWVVVFVRKSDFDLLQGSPDHQSAGNRHGATVLAALLHAEGIMPVALHFFSPDIDDLAYLQDIEQSGAFCPAQTVLVLNEGLIKDARPVDAAFAELREHSIFRAALKRGAKEIVLPRLSCMQEVNSRRLSFAGAEKELGLTNRQRVALWRRAVAKALAPIDSWLP
jgi:hypothetical protein